MPEILNLLSYYKILFSYHTRNSHWTYRQVSWGRYKQPVKESPLNYSGRMRSNVNRAYGKKMTSQHSELSSIKFLKNGSPYMHPM